MKDEFQDDFDAENSEKSVKKDEKISLTVAVKGNRKKMLQALRDKLAETIEKSESGRDIAALSKQLREVTAELDQIKAEEKAKRDKRNAAKNPSKRDRLRAVNAR